MEPIVDRVEDKYKNRFKEFKIVNVNTDEGKDLIAEFDLSLTPTFLILDENSKEIDRLTGGASQEVLEEFIEGNLSEAEGK